MYLAKIKKVEIKNNATAGFISSDFNLLMIRIYMNYLNISILPYDNLFFNSLIGNVK